MLRKEPWRRRFTPTALEGLAHYLPSTGASPSGRSRQTPQCRRPGRRGYAEGLVFIPPQYQAEERILDRIYCTQNSC